MPTEITMPKLSDTMEEGTILRWLKRVGERVEKGEVLAEVETDKADMELEADKAGTLAEIRVNEGEAAAVGAVLAILADSAAATPQEPRPQAVAAVVRPAAPASVPSPVQAPSPPAAPPKAAKPAVPPPPQREVRPPKPSAPPSTTPRPPAAATPQPAPTGRQEQSKLRLAVAKQMVASKRDAPHFYVTCEIDMSEVARLRASLAASAAISEHITFTHFIMRALALTLPRHPRMNASWSDGAITYHDEVNIGVAVAVEDGLIAPVVRGCQNLTLRQLARTTTDLVEKAQAGHFGGEGLTGGTFTLSNMGMLDIEEFSAVIIPPQAAILAVGAIKDRAVVRDGHLTVAKTMRVTLSADHRVLNGIEAGRFLEDLKRTLENPVLLVMGED
jgi:pyruvate dehydrogenase E2 component (dihydrolipoyllysine-residue acetyltransferase)